MMTANMNPYIEAD